MERIKCGSKDIKAVVTAKESDGLILLETQQHKDGTFVIFGTQEDYDAKYPLSLEGRITNLEDRIVMLEGAVVAQK